MHGSCDGTCCIARVVDLRAVPSQELIRELTRRCKDFEDREHRLQQLEARLMQVASNPSEVLDINAGGRVFSVQRGTLALARSSMLAALFSGKWDEGLPRDSQGRPFLEVDPYIFEKIVNFLRQKRLDSPDSPAPLPVIDPDKAEEFRRVILYYGLGEFFCLGPLGVRVQKLSREGQAKFYQDSNLRGYVVRLSAPIRLHGVLVGLRGDASGATVCVGLGSSEVLKEVAVQELGSEYREWRDTDPHATHVASGFDLTLHPPEVFIMVKPSSTPLTYAYAAGDNAARAAGPFWVESKRSLPLQPNTFSICMCVAYTD